MRAEVFLTVSGCNGPQQVMQRPGLELTLRSSAKCHAAVPFIYHSILSLCVEWSHSVPKEASPFREQLKALGFHQARTHTLFIRVNLCLGINCETRLNCQRQKPTFFSPLSLHLILFSFLQLSLCSAAPHDVRSLLCRLDWRLDWGPDKSWKYSFGQRSGTTTMHFTELHHSAQSLC